MQQCCIDFEILFIYNICDSFVLILKVVLNIKSLIRFNKTDHSKQKDISNNDLKV